MEEITKHKLIEINGTKLILNNIDFNVNFDKKCFVISMLGCARVGKSTFINALLSYNFNNFF